MAKQKRTPLLLKDNYPVMSLKELREHCDIDKLTKYFKSGELAKWLQSLYYEEEYSCISALSPKAKDLDAELYLIFDIHSPEAATAIERKTNREMAEEAERQARLEADRKIKEEAERKAREEAEIKAKKEAAQQARKAALRKAHEELGPTLSSILATLSLFVSIASVATIANPNSSNRAFSLKLAIAAIIIAFLSRLTQKSKRAFMAYILSILALCVFAPEYLNKKPANSSENIMAQQETSISNTNKANITDSSPSASKPKSDESASQATTETASKTPFANYTVATAESETIKAETTISETVMETTPTATEPETFPTEPETTQAPVPETTQAPTTQALQETGMQIGTEYLFEYEDRWKVGMTINDIYYIRDSQTMRTENGYTLLAVDYTIRVIQCDMSISTSDITPKILSPDRYWNHRHQNLSNEIRKQTGREMCGYLGDEESFAFLMAYEIPTEALANDSTLIISLENDSCYDEYELSSSIISDRTADFN